MFFKNKIKFIDIFDELRVNNKIDPFEINIKQNEKNKWLDISFSLIKVQEEKYVYWCRSQGYQKKTVCDSLLLDSLQKYMEL